MKRLLMPVKRFVCVLLICFSFCGVIVSDYVGAVTAYGAEVALSALYTALMETLMLSLGYSYSSESDLTAGGSALESVVSSAAEYVADGFENYNDLTTEARAETALWAFELALQLQGYDLNKLCYGDSVSLSREAYTGIQDWVKSMMRDKAVTISGFYSLDATVTILDDISTEDVVDFVHSVYSEVDFSVESSYSDAADLSEYDTIICRPYTNSDGSVENYFFYFDNFNAKYNRVAVLNDGVISFYRHDGSSFTFDKYYYIQPSFSFSADSRFFYGPQTTYNYFTDISGCAVLIDDSVPLYSSYANYLAYYNSLSYAPASSIYGSSDLAEDATESEDGTISIPIVEPYITEQVVSAVTDAITENPDATDEDINAKIMELIAGINDVKDTTGDIAEDTGTIIGLLTSVLANLKTIGQSVDELVDLISVTGGAAALDWTDVQDAFAEEEVEVSTGGNESDNDDDNDDKKGISPWVPGTIVTVGLLAPFVKFLSEPLSNITQYLDAVEEWIMDIPQTLDDAIATPIQDVIEAVAELPADFVSGLSEEFELEIYNPIDEILDILNDLLVIDAAQIMDACAAFPVVWENKFSFLDKFAAIFDYSFPSTYEYPVIQIKTPAILYDNEFYDQEYIVICDFADFKTQCQWARGLAKAVLWISFAFSVFKQFKVNLHIG